MSLTDSLCRVLSRPFLPVGGVELAGKRKKCAGGISVADPAPGRMGEQLAVGMMRLDVVN